MKPVPSARRPALPPHSRGPDRVAKSRTLPCLPWLILPVRGPRLSESAHAALYPGIGKLFRGGCGPPTGTLPQADAVLRTICNRDVAGVRGEAVAPFTRSGRNLRN